MADLGKVTNQLPKGGVGGGMGSACVNENAPLIKERPTDWWNPNEVNAHRGYARGAGGGSRRLTGGNTDVGGR